MGNIFSIVKINMAVEPEVLITSLAKDRNIVPTSKWS